MQTVSRSLAFLARRLRLLILSTCLCIPIVGVHAGPLDEEGAPATFVGTYGPSKKITIKLFRTGSQLIGSYINDQEKLPFDIQGKIESSGEFDLIESKNGSFYGRFRGKLIDRTLSGEWHQVGVDAPLQFLVEAKTHPVGEAPSTSFSRPTLEPAKAQVSGSMKATSSLEPRSSSSIPEAIESGGEGTKDTASKKKPTDRTVEYVLVTWASLVLLGIVLGMKGNVVVFRNYNDLAMVFAGGLAIASAFFLLISGWDVLPLFKFVTGIAVGMFLWLAGRTIVDNPNPIWAIIALVTKLTLSILFLFNLIGFVTPSGKTAAARASSRRFSFILLILLAPITLALVKEKTGIFSPDKLLHNRF